MILKLIYYSYTATFAQLVQPPRCARIGRLAIVLAIVFSVWIPSVREFAWLIFGSPRADLESWLTSGGQLAGLKQPISLDFTEVLGEYQRFVPQVLIILGLAAIYLSSVFHYLLVTAATRSQWQIGREYSRFRGKAFGFSLFRVVLVALYGVVAVSAITYLGFEPVGPLGASFSLALIGFPLALVHRFVIEFTVPLHHSGGFGFCRALVATFRLLRTRCFLTLWFLSVRWFLAKIILIGVLFISLPVIAGTLGAAIYVLWQSMVQGMPALIAGEWGAGLPWLAGGSLAFMAIIFFGTWLVWCLGTPGVLFLRVLSIEFLHRLGYLKTIHDD